MDHRLLHIIQEFTVLSIQYASPRVRMSFNIGVGGCRHNSMCNSTFLVLFGTLEEEKLNDPAPMVHTLQYSGRESTY